VFGLWGRGHLPFTRCWQPQQPFFPSDATVRICIRMYVLHVHAHARVRVCVWTLCVCSIQCIPVSTSNVARHKASGRCGQRTCAQQGSGSLNASWCPPLPSCLTSLQRRAHAQSHSHACTHAHACILPRDMSACMHGCTQTHKCTPMHTHTHTHTHPHADAQIHTHRHPQTPTDTHRHPQTPTDAHRHPQTPTDTHRHPQTPTDTHRHPRTPTDTHGHPQTPTDTPQTPTHTLSHTQAVCVWINPHSCLDQANKTNSWPLALVIVSLVEFMLR